jgi:F-type H+-transporting ATPase subunit epsilon
VEARDNEVVVLAEAAESPEQIDVARAEAAMTRAKERLSNRASDLDQARAEASLSRALNRLKVAGAR